VSSGFTLVELLAVITLLGVIGVLTGVGLASLREPEAGRVVRSLAEARAEAIRAGHAITWRNERDMVRFLADGSSSGGVVISGDHTVAIHPLTGSAHVVR
jgi:prepilin-type N-terminal cleavage/methylation domain-containing protein